MKKIIIICLSAFVLAQCNDQGSSNTMQTVTVKKVILKKAQTQETSYKFKYNPWTGNVDRLPDFHTESYFVFADGSHQLVDIPTYSIFNEGDSFPVTKVTLVETKKP